MDGKIPQFDIILRFFIDNIESKNRSVQLSRAFIEIWVWFFPFWRLLKKRLVTDFVLFDYMLSHPNITQKCRETHSYVIFHSDFLRKHSAERVGVGCPSPPIRNNIVSHCDPASLVSSHVHPRPDATSSVNWVWACHQISVDLIIVLLLNALMDFDNSFELSILRVKYTGFFVLDNQFTSRTITELTIPVNARSQH